MKRRTTEIYIETREKIIFRQTTAQEIETLCEACQIETVFVAPERAAFLFGLTMREIFRRLEDDSIHFIETADGLIRVCLVSLEMVKSSRIKLTGANNFEE